MPVANRYSAGRCRGALSLPLPSYFCISRIELARELVIRHLRDEGLNRIARISVTQCHLSAFHEPLGNWKLLFSDNDATIKLLEFLINLNCALPAGIPSITQLP